LGPKNLGLTSDQKGSTPTRETEGDVMEADAAIGKHMGEVVKLNVWIG
jgi:hypothetical protein